MIEDIKICKTIRNDINSLEDLYKKAFSEEDLFPLVTELLADEENVLSLSAYINKTLVGHVAFTKCYVSFDDIKLSLLGPVAVIPEYQRIGVGTKLITIGLKQLKRMKFIKVLVLGDPDYYKKFYFTQENDIEPAYEIPKQWKSAWQSLKLTGVGYYIKGTLKVPTVWQKPELWSQ